MKPHQATTLEDLSKRSDEVVAELRSSGRPVLLELGGEDGAAMQVAKTYESLGQQIERAEAVAGIKRGLLSMEQGEGTLARAVLNPIREKWDIPSEA